MRLCRYLVLALVSVSLLCALGPGFAAENDAERYNEHGKTLNDEGKHEEALTYLDEAIRLDPALALAYVNRGMSYRKLGRMDEALADYNKAIELDARIPEAVFQQGRSVCQDGQVGPG